MQTRWPPGHPFRAKLATAVSFVLACLLAAVAVGCTGSDVDIDFSELEAAPAATPAPSRDQLALRIAVAPVLSARATSALYQGWADYLARTLGRPVDLIQGKTYAEINDLVKSGDVAAALVCTNPYLEGRDDFGMELIAVPQVSGAVTYSSYLIVSRTSSAETLSDLRGLSFAFTDPLSNTGRLAPVYQLAIKGHRPDTFFSQTIFTHSHDGSIRAVADGVVAAAAVDSLVFDYLVTAEPSVVGRLKVIEKWGPFGINPVVANPRLDEGLKDALRRSLLDMDRDPEGQEILRSLMIDRFVVPDDAIYDSVREMRDFLRERGLVP